MKNLSFLIISFFIVSVSFSQTYNPNFLDGRIMFKMKTNVHTKEIVKRTDLNSYSKVENLANYPELALALKNFSISKFERPSFYTGKEELMKIYRIYFSDFSDIEQIIKKLKQLNLIEFAEKEPIYKTDFIPNDTYYTGTYKWYHTLVNSEQAWDISLGSNSVKVAIVDNAVYANHLDLTTFKQYDVADNDNDATPPVVYSSDQGWSHGTHTSGLATADINNNRGIASLGANVELIAVKATPNSASSESIWYGYDGIQWACENGANVVSMSFGGTTPSASTQTLINSYPEVVFLASAGNDGNTTVNYPAAYNNVIGVGSVDGNDSRSSFSNYNGSTPFVDIASPGGFTYGGLMSTVYSTSGNTYGLMSGTSMSCPFAAGLVGLMLSVNPTLTPTQIENCLISSGVNINQNVGPRIDAYAAMQCVQSTLTGDPFVNFWGAPVSIYEGQTVTYYDNSAGGGNPISNWQWLFPGGTPSSYTGQTPPVITYSVSGIYDVTLTVTNSQSSQTLTRTGYINVSMQPYGAWLEEASGFATASRGINFLSVVDQNTIWATAYDGSGTAANIQEFTKTTNGGTTWTPGTINIGNTALGISMIHAFDANTAWLAAYPNAAGQTGGVWKTTNGGTTWTRQNTALYNNAASFTNVVYFWNANIGFCMGDPINSEFEIYNTTNGGTTWTPISAANIPNPLSGEYGYTREIEVVGNDVWFTTNKGRIYHSTDKGLTFQVFQTPVTDFGSVVTPSFTSSSTGLIVVSDSVYKTFDGGATWNLLNTTGSVFSTGLCYIVGTDTVFSTGAGGGTSGSSYSVDGGLNWNIVDNAQHLFVEFINSLTGWSGWFNTDATSQGMWKWYKVNTSLFVDFSGSPVNACVGDTVNFTDLTTGGTPISWQWSFPGGTPSTSTLQNPSVVYSAVGSYNVSLTVDDGNGPASKQTTGYINVLTTPSQPGPILGSAFPCQGANITYSVTNVPNVFYTWTVPTGWTGTSTTNSLLATIDTAAGQVKVTADNVCGSSLQRTKYVTPTKLPVAGFTYIDNQGTVSFTSTSTNATSYSWNFGDLSTGNTANPTHTYTNVGNFLVTLIVTNSCGTDTITQVINITIIGINEVIINNINIYPNPVKDMLFIDLNNSNLINSEISITDIPGNIVINNKIDKLNYSIDLSKLNKGMYFININNVNTYKFVKE